MKRDPPSESKLLAQKEAYINDMLRNPRLSVLIVTLINLIFSVKHIAVQDAGYEVDYYYLVISVATFIFVVPSYANTRYNNLVRFGFMLCAFRQAIFPFDFPGTRDLQQPDKWVFLCGVHSCYTTYAITLHYYYFNHEEKGHSLFGISMAAIHFAGFFSAANRLQNWELEPANLMFLAFALVFTIVIALGMHNVENFSRQFVEAMLQHSEDQRLLKLVLDNYSEGIVIFDDQHHLRYTNPKFNSICNTESAPSDSEEVLSPSPHRRGNSRFNAQELREPKSQPSQAVSILEQQMFSPEKDPSTVLSFHDLNSDPQQCEASTFRIPRGNDHLFVKIRRSTCSNLQETLTVFSLIDVSESILYNETKQQNELLSILNASISHELRNPLNSIVCQGTILDCLAKKTDLLLQQSTISKEELQGLNSKVKSVLSVQDSSARMMSFLVQDFLDYAQIRASKFRVVEKPFNIRKAVEQVIMIQRQKAEEQGILLRADFTNFDGLSDIIITDEQRLKQVLLNILSNALKFTKQGSVRVKAELLSDDQNEYVTISVTDTGIGIPYADQDKLFKLFGFLKSTESVNKNGVGLGLVISQQIVTQLGGEISFSSRPEPEEGHGSTFSFSLRLQDPHSTRAESLTSKHKSSLKKPFAALDSYRMAPSSQGIPSEEGAQSIRHHMEHTFSLRLYNEEFEAANRFNQLRPERILIADDQHFNILALKGILELVCQVNPELIDVAHNGEEAVKTVLDDAIARNGACSYKIIFMDCNMPFMDGFEATSNIRSMLTSDFSLPEKDQPRIVAVTGHVEPDYLSKCLSSGMDSVLSKPVDKDSLMSLLLE